MTPELFKKLRAIKEGIEQQVKADVNDRNTPADTIAALYKTYDIDIVKWFFAETVKAAEWDGRFSKQTKEWANQLYIPGLSGEDGKQYGQISDSVVHRAHINQLVEEIIKHEKSSSAHQNNQGI